MLTIRAPQKCSLCGAPIKWDGFSYSLKCDFCGNKIIFENYSLNQKNLIKKISILFNSRRNFSIVALKKVCSKLLPRLKNKSTVFILILILLAFSGSRLSRYYYMKNKIEKSGITNQCTKESLGKYWLALKQIREERKKLETCKVNCIKGRGDYILALESILRREFQYLDELPWEKRKKAFTKKECYSILERDYLKRFKSLKQ